MIQLTLGDFDYFIFIFDNIHYLYKGVYPYHLLSEDLNFLHTTLHVSMNLRIPLSIATGLKGLSFSIIHLTLAVTLSYHTASLYTTKFIPLLSEKGLLQPFNFLPLDLKNPL